MSNYKRTVLHVETLQESQGFLYIVTTGRDDFYLETVQQGKIHSRVAILHTSNNLPQPLHPIFKRMAVWFLTGESSAFVDLPLDD